MQADKLPATRWSRLKRGQVGHALTASSLEFRQSFNMNLARYVPREMKHSASVYKVVVSYHEISSLSYLYLSDPDFVQFMHCERQT